MQNPNIYVVKFGGSLLASNKICEWIAKLDHWSRDKSVILVPGGGEFADAVRFVQTRCEMSDESAHKLALGAMRLLGKALTLLSDRKPVFHSISEIERNKFETSFRIWVPSDQEFRETAMPENWSVTSDSISLWLANYLDASDLLLLKSKAAPHADPSRWSESAYVDEYFAELALNSSCCIRAISDCKALLGD